MTDLNRAVPRLSLLSDEQCRMIHRASLEILEKTGMRVFHEKARQLLREHGAVISDDTLVKFPAELVSGSLQSAPSQINLYKRGTDQAVVQLTGTQVSFGTGSDCLNYLDPRSGERRPFTIPDVIDAIHVVDALPELDFCMSMGIPAELGEDNAYLQQFGLMMEHTTKPLVFVCDDVNDCQMIAAMAESAAGSSQALRDHPTLLLYSEPSTPLQHSETATGKLLYMAEHGLPIVHSPAPMMGGTSPITLAGGLAVGNAEVLSSLVLHQLQREGAPFVYGSGLHHMDMKTMISVYGAPEFQLARVAVAEMGRYYGLPTWGYAGHSDSCIMDEQAAADAAFSVLVALLGGNNLVHDVGYLEGGLTTSPEMVVFSAEMISMMRRFGEGISFNEGDLALDVIHQVGPGGDFLAADHTFEQFRDFWQPQLFSRQRVEEWLQNGSLRLSDTLREKTISLIEEHQPEPLPDSVKEELKQIINER
ncbi:MAG: trimethylamine methyltransferase family protein [Chloroflexi bacterium]|nr:trimethylamine methyltransferase family protein [Chloroflexota bacterium]